MADPEKAFVSYSRADADFVLRLCKDLRDAGGAIWLDQLDIQTGEEWDQEIQRGLAECGRMVVVLSPKSVASQNVLDEIGYALSKKKRIFPVMHQDCEVPYRLSRLHYADFRKTYGDGLRELLSAMGEAATEPLPRPEPLSRERILDAAIPAQTTVNRSTELLVLVRLPSSEGLAGMLIDDSEADADPNDVRSRPFEIAFPQGPTGQPDAQKIAVNLTSPDFDPPSQTKNIFVPPDRDSPVCTFLLTPLRTGRLKLLIELQWQDALGGHRRLLTECQSETESARQPTPPVLNVTRLGIAIAAAARDEDRAVPRATLPAPLNRSYLPRGILAAAAVLISVIGLSIWSRSPVPPSAAIKPPEAVQRSGEIQMAERVTPDPPSPTTPTPAVGQDNPTVPTAQSAAKESTTTRAKKAPGPFQGTFRTVLLRYISEAPSGFQKLGAEEFADWTPSVRLPGAISCRGSGYPRAPVIECALYRTGSEVEAVEKFEDLIELTEAALPDWEGNRMNLFNAYFSDKKATLLVDLGVAKSGDRYDVSLSVRKRS